MNFIKEKLGQFGGFLALMGVVSIILHFFNYELRLLMWIDLWGTTVAWAIRIGLIVVGLLLMFLTTSGEKEKEKE